MKNKHDLLKTFLRAAASILVIFTASLFYYAAYQSAATEDAKEPVPVHYSTAVDQQKQ